MSWETNRKILLKFWKLVCLRGLPIYFWNGPLLWFWCSLFGLLYLFLAILAISSSSLCIYCIYSTITRSKFYLTARAIDLCDISVIVAMERLSKRGTNVDWFKILPAFLRFSTPTYIYLLELGRCPRSFKPQYNTCMVLRTHHPDLVPFVTLT